MKNFKPIPENVSIYQGKDYNNTKEGRLKYQEGMRGQYNTSKISLDHTEAFRIQSLEILFW